MNVVILGCGRVGAQLAGLLDQAGHTISVIDSNSESFQRLSADFRGATHIGNGVDEDTLDRAGIRQADAFIAVTNGDNRNIMAGQIAKELFKVKKVVCRIYDPIREETYRELGLETFSPTRIGAQIIFDMIMDRKQK